MEALRAEFATIGIVLLIIVLFPSLQHMLGISFLENSRKILHKNMKISNPFFQIF